MATLDILCPDRDGILFSGLTLPIDATSDDAIAQARSLLPFLHPSLDTIRVTSDGRKYLVTEARTVELHEFHLNGKE